jgi:hypothetical protein
MACCGERARTKDFGATGGGVVVFFAVLMRLRLGFWPCDAIEILPFWGCLLCPGNKWARGKGLKPTEPPKLSPAG